MELFNAYPIMDNTTGMAGDMHVELVNCCTLRFTPDANPNKVITTDQLKKPDAGLFLEFAAIRNEAKKAWHKERGDSEGADNVGFMRAYHQKIIDFACEHGPLFGFAGLSETEPAIEEPLQNWLDAQRVMETTLLLNVFVEGGDVHADEVADIFPIVSIRTPEQLVFAYQYRPDVYPNDLYAHALRDDFEHWFTTNDETIIGGQWLKCTTENGMCAVYNTRYSDPTNNNRFLYDVPVMVPFETAFEHEETREELPSLLKIVAQAHSLGAYLGFKNFNAVASKNEGGYQVLFESMLAFMWNELSLTYSRRAFRRCANPRCDNIIAENLTTGIAKEYCCDACRAQVNNAKHTEQRRRGRLSFYAVNDLLTIYEDAFGVEPRLDDPDCRAKMERLKRWIEKDYSKSKRGKIAIAKGAARMPQHK